jgi:hypothetical protein
MQKLLGIGASNHLKRKIQEVAHDIAEREIDFKDNSDLQAWIDFYTWWREDKILWPKELETEDLARAAWLEKAQLGAATFKVNSKGIQLMYRYRGELEASGSRGELVETAKRRRLMDSDQELKDAKAQSAAIHARWQQANVGTQVRADMIVQPSVNVGSIANLVTNTFVVKSILTPLVVKELVERRTATAVAEVDAWCEAEAAKRQQKCEGWGLFE